MFNPGIVAHRKRTGGSLILRDITTAVGANHSGNLTIATPSHSAGDLIIMTIATRQKPTAVTVSGFTLVAQIEALTAVDSHGRSTVLQNTAGTNEPSSYSIDAGGGNGQYTTAACYSFVNYGVITSRTSRKKNTAQCISPAINLTADDVYAMSVVTKAEWCYDGITPPVGMTKDAEQVNNQALANGHQYFENVTSVGAFEWSDCSSVGDYTTGITVIVRKA